MTLSRARVASCRNKRAVGYPGIINPIEQPRGRSLLSLMLPPPTCKKHHGNSAHFQKPIPTEAKYGAPDKPVDVME